jgi:chromosomal replication initiation ATPase DnaA
MSDYFAPLHRARRPPQIGVGKYRRPAPELVTLLDRLCAESQVTTDEILARDNRWHIVKVRRIFAQSARELGYSLPAIGAALHRHHTTVMNLLVQRKLWEP